MCIHTEKVQYRLGEDVAPQSKFFTLLVLGEGSEVNFMGRLSRAKL